MESITIKCEKCKNRFKIEIVTGVYLCTVCDCKNEHYVFPNSFTDEQIRNLTFFQEQYFQSEIIR